MVFRSSAEHDFGGKNAVLMGERTCTAVFLRNMVDRPDADSVSLSLGRTENSVLFVDFTVKRIFNLDQEESFGMHICGYFDLPAGRRGAQAGFQCIFQQVG